MAVQDWSSVAASNTSVGGLNTDGTIQTINNIDNMLRGMMADIRTGIDAGYFLNTGFASKSGNYTAVVADRGDLLHFTAAATLSLTAAATLTTGWWIMVRATGAAVLVDPNGAELINGLGSMTVADGTSAIIVCDGTGFRTLGDYQLAPKKHKDGLTLANNGSDAVNDIDIAVGEAASDTSPFYRMILASALTKRLDANWVVGTNQGGLDTGAIADTNYHVFLIQRSDTGVVDVLFSASPTSPTMPSNYDRKRRIGSIIRSGGTILGFTHVGRNTFVLNASFTMRNSTAALASSLLTFAVPSGIQCEPLIGVNVAINANSTGTTTFGSASVGTVTTNISVLSGTSATTTTAWAPGGFLTNTSQQIYAAVVISAGSLASHVISCSGWVDSYL